MVVFIAFLQQISAGLVVPYLLEYRLLLVFATRAYLEQEPHPPLPHPPDRFSAGTPKR
jgi:hypothetical protein